MQGNTPFVPFQHNISPFIIGKTTTASSKKDNLMGTPKTEAGLPNLR